jgi:hypothetical protein
MMAARNDFYVFLVNKMNAARERYYHFYDAVGFCSLPGDNFMFFVGSFILFLK